MNVKRINAGTILDHFRTEHGLFKLKKDRSGPTWNDEMFHRNAYDKNPVIYALCAVADEVVDDQKLKALFQLLRSSRVGLDKNARQILDRVVVLLLTVTHPDQVLTVFLALRRVRANHKHTTRAIVRYILNHPFLEDMAVGRRSSLADCLEHALGKNTARGYARMTAGKDMPATEKSDPVLKFAVCKDRARSVIPFIFREKGLQVRRKGAYRKVHQSYAEVYEKTEKKKEYPKTITPTNRGDIAATLVHIYRGGTNPELKDALEEYVALAAESLPECSGKIALVLDASESTRGYGEREYACISQSVAFSMVLEKCAPDFSLTVVGGEGFPPVPERGTDLASGLLSALEGKPDIVVIVSDGYENIYQGDLKNVINALPGAGIDAQVIFCHSMFTAKDDLELRRPVPGITESSFWHQDDFENVIISILLMTESESEKDFLYHYLVNRLEIMEGEVKSWMH